MKILVTGSAGRVGSAIYRALKLQHEVVGIDLQPSASTDRIGDIRDTGLLASVLENVEVIVHVAALHAPHVGNVADTEFDVVNVQATEKLVSMAVKQQVKHIVYTSTTALYGFASTPPGRAGWIDESIAPQPRTVYHHSKIHAERILEEYSNKFGLPVTILQMSRCFPEPANLMAVYRLSRGVDARDVASAHVMAVTHRLSGFKRFIISAKTPFTQSQCEPLYRHANEVIRECVPALADEFLKRGWPLPKSLDRVYDSSLAQQVLGWQPKHGYESVLDWLDHSVPEVLPAESAK